MNQKICCTVGTSTQQDSRTEPRKNVIISSNELKKKGIGSEVYYINPVHHMPFYRENFGSAKLPQTEKASKQVFSLPIHPGVTDEQIRFIGETVLSLI